MIIHGEYVFAGPRESVWDLLQDPAVLVKAMPGAKELVLTSEGVYEGVVRIGVGPVTAAEWRMTVTLSDLAPPASYNMAVESKGPIGFTRGTATVELRDEVSETRMCYRADLQVGGKVAGVGQRLLDQVAKLLTKQGLNALSRELSARLAAAPPPPAPLPGPGGLDDADPDNVVVPLSTTAAAASRAVPHHDPDLDADPAARPRSFAADSGDDVDADADPTVPTAAAARAAPLHDPDPDPDADPAARPRSFDADSGGGGASGEEGAPR